MADAVELATHEWLPPGPDAGSAPLAVLVHGLSGWHRTWWRVAPALAERGWRVMTVDQRGHGDSPRIDGFATMADLAADLAAAIQRAGATADVVIGHSLGAAVAAEVAFLHPELARRVVLEDPPTIIRAGDAQWLESLDTELRAADADPEAEVVRELAENPAWLEGDARQDVDGKRLADREGLLESFRRPTGHRVLEVVPQLEVPALYLLAREADSATPGADRRKLEATLPGNARLEVFDSGHTIHRDRFVDYLATILDWLGPS